MEEVGGKKLEGLDGSENCMELEGIGVSRIVDGEELSSLDGDVPVVRLDDWSSEGDEGEVKDSGVVDLVGEIEESENEELIPADEDCLDERAVAGD